MTNLWCGQWRWATALCVVLWSAAATADPTASIPPAELEDLLQQRIVDEGEPEPVAPEILRDRYDGLRERRQRIASQVVRRAERLRQTHPAMPAGAAHLDVSDVDATPGDPDRVRREVRP